MITQFILFGVRLLTIVTAPLKAIGNGVCPQQAAAALEQLLALEAVAA